MPDIVQRVKYTVQVDATELDAFKAKIDATNTSVNTLSTAFGALKTNVDKGLLKSLSTLNTRLNRTSVVGKAAHDALDQLGKPVAGLQSAIDTLAKKFDDFSKGLKSAVNDLKKVNDELKKIKKEQGDAGDVGDKAGEKVGMRWLKVFGVFQSAKFAVQEFFNAAKEGAQQMDLERVLSKQFSKFEETITKAQELTKGTVSEGGLTKSYALMSSFGIPMDKFAENMELVQKMAIRTGQSADYLTESFARGIARLSPLILDNLGIQVKLGEANEEYAQQTGILTTEMTKEQKTAALLNHVLGKLRENTAGVSLTTESAAASANRAEAAFDNLLMKGKKVAGLGIQGWDMTLQSQQSDIEHYVDVMTNLTRVLPDEKMASNLNAFFGAMAKSKDGADLLSSFDFIMNEGRGDVTAVADMFSTGADALARFDRLAKGAAAGTRELELAFNTIADSPWAKKFLMTDEDLASVGVFDLMKRNLEEATKQATDLLDSMGDMVTEKDRQVILDKAQAAASAATVKRMQDAVKYAKEHNLDREETILLMTRETSEFEKQRDLWIEILDKSYVSRVSSEFALKQMAEELAISEKQVDLAQELFDINGGQRIAELELNEILEARGPIQKVLEDAQKALADAVDDTAKVEAQRSIIAANNALVEQDALRATAQAAMLADKAVLDSYQNMSKEKLRETLTMVKAQISLMNFSSDPLLKDRKNAEIAELQKTADIIQKLIDKPRGGGGGGGHKKKSVVEEIFGDPIKIEEFFSLDLGGKVRNTADMIRDAYATVHALSIPGRMGGGGFGSPGGGFLGFTSFFGSLDRGEFESGQEMAKQLKAMMADLEAAGISDIFTEADSEAMGLFMGRMNELEAHFNTLDRWAESLAQVSTAMGTFHDGMSGLFGDDITSWIGDLTSGIEGFTTALEANAGAYGLVNAAMPVVRSFTKNLIKDRQAQAAVEALMQGAAAWAAYAAGNIPGGIMHTAAAGMYLAVAGGALRLPKGKSKDDKPKDDAAKYAATKMRDIHIHIGGPTFMTEAERGAAMRDAIRAADRAGM